jgi:hypothetical protein
MDNIAQYLQMLDVSGGTPTMQDISGQRNLYQQNINTMKTLGQQALGGQQASPLQSLADALRAQQKPGLGVGQIRDNQGNIVPDPTYGNVSGSSVMQNPTYNPYENPI